MQLTALTVFASAVASVSASLLTPKDTALKFFLVARTTNLSLDGQFISAKDNQLWLAWPLGEQGADCGGDPSAEELATFALENGELFLYGGENTSHQQVGVDVAALDYENLAYFNNSKPHKRVDTTGWVILNDLLSLYEHQFLACPKSDGVFTVGVTLGNLDSDTNCHLFDARVISHNRPVSCTYSERPVEKEA